MGTNSRKQNVLATPGHSLEHSVAWPWSQIPAVVLKHSLLSPPCTSGWRPPATTRCPRTFSRESKSLQRTPKPWFTESFWTQRGLFSFLFLLRTQQMPAALSEICSESLGDKFCSAFCHQPDSLVGSDSAIWEDGSYGPCNPGMDQGGVPRIEELKMWTTGQEKQADNQLTRETHQQINVH